MASALERLQRILELEARQAWRNRAVIGGMAALAERWAGDARGEEVDGRMIEALTGLMGEYDEAEEEARPDVAERMRDVIAGDVHDWETIVSTPISRPVAQQLSKIEPAAESSAVAAEPEDVGDAATGGRGDEVPAAQSSTALGRGVLDRATGGEAKSPNEKPLKPKPTKKPKSVPPPEPTHKARERVRKQKQQRAQATLSLDGSVTQLSGVGGATAENLSRLGIETVRDMIWHLPARHEDYSELRTIDKLEPGEQVTVIANLWEIRERKLSMKRTMVQGILADGTGTLHATWWNKWITKQLTPNTQMRFSGKVGLYMGQKTLDNPTFEELDEERVATGRIAPVYPLTESVSNKRLRDWIKQALDGAVSDVADPLPESVLESHELVDIQTALEQMHFPDDQESLAEARRRLGFEEFFYVQLGAMQRRRELRQTPAPPVENSEAAVEQFLEALPFDLTGAQDRVLGEILRDVARSVPMTRLVQGDVGSGKTAVAAGAMFAAAASGMQSAMLAPTQILAEQHHRSLDGMLSQLQKPDGTPLIVALLTGRVTGQAREAVLDGLRNGTVDVVVGTTALIQEGVAFENLGFVVVDEQHRFGVEQRGALRNKGTVASEEVDQNDEDLLQPHLLVMSATPIPRSLALTIYGDLDVSIIDEMPPGRQPVMTKWFMPAERERLYGFLRREAREGRQGYLIYPLVEESEKLEVGAAVEAHQKLSSEILPELRLGLLHGRMTGSEKDETMRAFAEGDYDALVSTTVVEVGVDVPNATLMIVEDAERFGLAQLHQLRGRVGRGSHKSYCALVSKGESAQAQERLNALVETNDGFVLAEKDLSLRGPGDFLGTKQSGLPNLRVALLSDLETLKEARSAAQQFFDEDAELSAHPTLAAEVERFWSGHGDVS